VPGTADNGKLHTKKRGNTNDQRLVSERTPSKKLLSEKRTKIKNGDKGLNEWTGAERERIRAHCRDKTRRSKSRRTQVEGGEYFQREGKIVGGRDPKKSSPVFEANWVTVTGWQKRMEGSQDNGGDKRGTTPEKKESATKKVSGLHFPALERKKGGLLPGARLGDHKAGKKVRP